MQQILIRNPLAFRKKIVEPEQGKQINVLDQLTAKTTSKKEMEILMEALRLPKNQNNTQNMRHMKGCNCRKSNCLKKYCECYQNGVPCSDLCKCEGCKNCKVTDKYYNKPTLKLLMPLDLNKVCAEVTIKKLLEPHSPETLQV